MRFLLYIVLVCFFISGFSEEKSPVSRCCKPSNPPRSFYTSATFLYFYASERGLSYALTNSTKTQFAPNIGASLVNMDFEYKPGVRLGFGYVTNHDDWDIYSEYTRFYQTTSSSKKAPQNGSLFTFWLKNQNQGFAESASAKWNLDMDILDIELGRSGAVQGVVFRPFFGLRSMWLDQKYNVSYFDVIPASTQGVYSEEINSKNKSSSWALGPRFGVDTQWIFGKGIYLLGDIAGSLIYTSYKVSHRESNTFGNMPSFILKNSPENLRANLELALGLGWGTSIYQNRYHMDLSAGYEFHYFWNQNEMTTLGKVAGFSFGGGGMDLSLHGLSLKVRFEF